ncbi:undecaprenyldiphospho-muramoylpentapeptide beta-N-acetylglucosaminyltransferase [Limibaculum sp. FT325]|uniref:undecaprenyldiphospho-muramoylpentapeptide beta-N-acetylglucosaminyltransferase n=1 Tax=Thermohalobaculum sediminis TaxID=2939436 RepID=UPI0020C131A8|nr:undecaprenyldiphospho-muramoylpentapeptide beta-N-acetylglucosaminyltransferase [Limibaculum sediminis]MCL5777845.1 undecaprenyldiphospho-muramoylpentapeptide beta-N-acetylglucosaminyltransferase [Limibaculum sediminis]
MSAPLLVIAAGGTGGHMFPAQALAEAMLARGWRVRLATDARGLRYAGGFPAAVERTELPSATIGQGGIAARLAAPVVILRGILRALGQFRAERPDVVAGFGGYPSLPALTAAWLMGLPRLIHEQNGVLGRVNRLFARRVDRVCCGTWPVVNAPEGARLEHVGNPVRAEAAARAAADFIPPGEGEARLLVFGGSQGASVFARLVPAALGHLPAGLRARIRLTQQVRPGEEAAVARACTEAGVEAELAPFFADMPARIAGAHLVVARAGASTIAELTAIGRPAILVPYPHATDDHQSANAAALAEAGGALVIPEAGLTPEILAQPLAALLTDPVAAARMAVASRALGRPDAASRLAGIVAALGNRAAG